jgi:pyruvate formate lyase activating enzyme
VVNIVRGSHEDGPGIRSVVFFKGCPLRCVFCHNPETQEPGQELAFSAERCLRCGSCLEVCPESALDLDLPGRVLRERCTLCGACAAVCPSGGLRIIGRYHSPQELAQALLRDSPFYRYSGGGVTLSGGECASHPRYLESLMLLLKEKGIHLALETGGYFDYPSFEKRILPHLDLIYFDLKFMDRLAHQRHTGKTNELILANFRRLISETEIEVLPRLPLVPGLTATRENFRATIDFLRRAGAGKISLLPYNPLGLPMNTSLGRPVPDLPLGFMKPNEEEELFAQFRALVRERKLGAGSSGVRTEKPPTSRTRALA